MTTQLLQILIGIVMYALMGLIVGVGITLVRKYPEAGEFLKERPVIGWTIAFAVGYTVHSTIMFLFEFITVALVSLARS